MIRNRNKPRGPLSVMVLAGACMAAVAAAQDPATDGDDAVKRGGMQQLVAAPGEEQGAVEPTMADIMTELIDLRAEVLRLQNALDGSMSSAVSELAAENERLRRELRNAYGKDGMAPALVPGRSS